MSRLRDWVYRSGIGVYRLTTATTIAAWVGGLEA